MSTTSYDVMIRIEADLANLSRGLNTADSAIANLGSRAQSSGNIIRQALSVAGGLGILNAIEGIGDKFMEAARMGWDFNAQMEQNLASFKTMLNGSDVEAKKMITSLQKMAAVTPFETTDLTKAATTLMGFGVEASKVEGTLKMLGDVSQGNRDKFNSLTLAFSQVQAAGKLTGQDLLQMVNAGFNPLKTMSEQTGMSLAALKDKMSDGAISAKMVEDAFVSATSKGGLFYGAMDAQSKTFSGQMSTLRDNVSLTFGQILQPAFENISKVILPAVINKLSQFQQAFQTSGSLVTAFTSSFSGANAHIKAFMNIITPIYSEVMPQIRTAFSNISSEVMPSLMRTFDVFTKTIIPNLRDGFMGYVENVLPVYKNAIYYITTTIMPPLIKIFEFMYTEVLPKFSKMFKDVMPLIGKLVKDLWDTIKPILNYIVDSFEKSWPIIKKSVLLAIDIITPAIKGLIVVLGGIITFLKGVFTGDWQMIWQGIKDIFMGIWNAIDTISTTLSNKIIETLTAFGTSILNGFKQTATEAVVYGENILKGLWTGMSNSTQWVLDKVKEFSQGISNTIKNFFGIASPSKLTTTFGEQIAEGLSVGIDKNSEKAAKATKRMFDKVSIEAEKASKAAEMVAKKAAQALEKAAEKAAEKAKNMAKQIIDTVSDIGDATITGLRNKYTEQERLGERAINAEIKKLRSAYDTKKAIYASEYADKLRVLNLGATAEEKAIQDKIDNLNNLTDVEEKQLQEQQYQAKLLQAQIAFAQATDADKKIEIQAEMNRMIADNERQHVLELRQTQIDAYEADIQVVRDQVEARRVSLEAEYKDNVDNNQKILDNKISSKNVELDMLRAHFETLLSEENLQAEARTLLLDKNNAELIGLLATYNSKWQNAGQSFGESLLKGLNSQEDSIRATITRMSQLINLAPKLSEISEVATPSTAAKIRESNTYIRSSTRKTPKYASGTNFASGGPSLVGENGPEIVNLPRGSKVTPNGSIIDYKQLAQELVMALKQAPLQVNVNQAVTIDGQKAAKVLWPKLAEEKVRLGVASL